MGIRSQLTLTLLLVVALAWAAGPRDRPDFRNEEKQNSFRFKRQEVTSTTTKVPPKRRPQGIFSLFTTLLRETRDDARRAFNDIGELFNSQFTTPKPVPTMSSTTGDDGEVSSTTEPYRISRKEFNGIIRSNLVGIGRLFGKELRNAISDSGKNLVQFGKELRTQVRPYVEIRTGSRNITST